MSSQAESSARKLEEDLQNIEVEMFHQEVQGRSHARVKFLQDPHAVFSHLLALLGYAVQYCRQITGDRQESLGELLRSGFGSDKKCWLTSKGFEWRGYAQARDVNVRSWTESIED